ncbi:non-ribosomal peptide synthase/polyketide synthase [Dictyobacter alpinus]|uniref:non-ribosomal peptide synthase/polyketide synthase n=1 Tax=Dictyobacter alpinus TaxID=2014873 RepID=UPI0035317A6A
MASQPEQSIQALHQLIAEQEIPTVQAPASTTESTQAYQAPQSPIEQLVAGVWSEVLGKGGIGIHEDFFALGGHSLIATQLLARLRTLLQLELPLRLLFEHPTISTQARAIEQELRRKASGLQEPPIVAVDRQQPLPLSFAQQRLWFLDQLEPGSITYNTPITVRLRGPLQVALLEKSLARVIQRHESLRTIFPQANGQPLQLILEQIPARLRLVDMVNLPEELVEQEVQQQSLLEAQQSFNLATGPLLRMTLLRIGPHEHIFLLTIHHIITDGWSMDIFVQEVGQLYNALQSNQPSPLADLPIQYADFALWQQQWFKGKILDQQLHYWEEQLRGVEPLELPVDHARPAIQNYHGAYQERWLPLTLYRQLQDLSQRHNVTLYMTLLAAFQVLLARYSNQVDIAVGTPIANRTRPEIEALIGFFINILVMRGDLSHNPTFTQLLQQVRATALGAYAHQDIPFEKLVEELQPERSINRSPLFQVAFVLQNTPHATETIAELQIDFLESPHTTARVDLTLELTETAQGIHCLAIYNTDLFEANTIQRLLEHWHMLLAGIVTQPEQQVFSLPLLGTAERELLLHTWNATQDSAAAHPIHLQTLFEQQVQRRPDQVALQLQEGHLTYAELDRRANQLAHHLRERGVKAEVLVGLCVERSFEMLIGMLGILKAGGAYVPLDPTYPEERLAYMLEDARIEILLTQHHLTSQLAGTLYTRQTIHLDRDWQAIAQYPMTIPHWEATAQQTAYQIYTSGSTGRPKGTQVTHQGINNLVQAQRTTFSVGEESRVLQFASFSFDASVFEISMALLTGGVLCLDEPRNLLPGPELLATLKKYAITIVTLPPSSLANLPYESLPKLSNMVVAGEACAPELIQRWGRGRRFFNAYGPTEATIWSSVSLYQSEYIHKLDIGKPISNTRLYILDRYMRPLPIGVPGDLYISGIGLARGYWRQPGLTAERFLPDPFSTEGGARLYQTGDRARYLADGKIDFLGRNDHQVKLRGHRIELGEIESSLRELADIEQSIALIREDVPGDPRLVTYVTISESSRLSNADIHAHLRSRLPDYMTPAFIVSLPHFPLLPNGKIDRKALPNPHQVYTQADEAEPQTCTWIEELLLPIWCKVLDLESAGIHENFFEQGGHSLLSTQLMAQMQAVFQVEIPQYSLFESPTIAGLARHIEDALKQGQRQEIPPIITHPRPEVLPLSFAQQRLWFMDQLEQGDSTTYNIPLVMKLTGTLKLELFTRTLQILAQRHETLRTTFREQDNGQPAQVIHPQPHHHLHLLDLQHLPEEEREREAHRLLHQEGQQPFNLITGPLMRSYLLRLTDQEHIFLLTMHHIVTDAVSMGIFTDEFSAIYNQLLAGAPVALPELPIQYADFALWQQQWLQQQVIDEQMHYWSQHLKGLVPLELPTDHARPTIQTYQGEHQHMRLPARLRNELTEISRRENCTLFMTLLAAFQVLLARYSGQSDIAIGTPFANRTRTEVDGLIGFFVNTLVMRSDLSGDPTFEELLLRVREVALGAYTHQDVPFVKLVEELQPERDPSRSPLFQVLLNVQHAPQAASVPGLVGLNIEQLEQEYAIAKYDLSLILVDEDSGLDCEIQYSTNLFEDSTIRRLLHHWHILLQNIVAHPERRISELSILSPAEQTQILEYWNDTQQDVSDIHGFHELFEAQARAHPQRLALLCGDEKFTYQQLDQQANQLAHALLDEKLAPESIVGICLPRSPELLITILAILKSGAAYVALDPSLPTPRLHYIVEQTQPRLLITGNEAYSPPVSTTLPILCWEQRWWDSCPVTRPQVRISPDQLAYVVYTSGSTGRPKGIQANHRGIINYLAFLGSAYKLGTWTIALQLASYAFDASIRDTFGPLSYGGRLVMAPHTGGLEPRQMLNLIESYHINALPSIVPSVLRLLLEVAEQQARPLPDIELVLMSGEAVYATDIQRASAIFSPHVRLVNQYGPTETTMTATYHQFSIQETVQGTITVGQPIANMQVYILDRYLQPVPAKVYGDVYISGPGLARGYLHQPTTTAESFIPHPYSKEEGTRLYRTGDRARYLLDGNIELAGREDHQVKIRGIRVELGEIETVIAQHPAIRSCAVVAQSDEHHDTSLIAYIVGQQEQPLTQVELRAYLQEMLPAFMQPGHIVTLKNLPLTPNGKIDRRALPAPDQEQHNHDWESATEAEQGRSDITPPQGWIEEIIAGVWCEILGTQYPDREDNFFEVGGHSLRAMQLIARLRQALQIDLSLGSLFEDPTIMGLALSAAEEMRADDSDEMAPPIKAVSRQHHPPLSFAQQRLWFLDQLDPESTAYTMALALKLQGALELTALQKACNEMVHRHESLRTTFTVIEQQPVQVIADTQTLSVPLINLEEMQSGEHELLVQTIMRQEVQQPFTLAQGPLVRITLLRLHQREHILLLSMHHIISDAWSMGILLREISQLYNAFAAGEPSPLPPLKIHYADYAVWQQSQRQQQILAAQMAYWKRQLHALPVLNLPLDYPRPALQSTNGAHQHILLSPALQEKLKELSRREGATLFMTLLTAFKVLLARYCQQTDIAIGTDIAGRTRTEIEQVIGFFVNTLVLRTDLAGNQTFQAALQRVRKIAIEAYAYQDVPFEKLVEELQPERDLSRSPLFQVAFSLQQPAPHTQPLRGLRVDVLNQENTTTKFDLALAAMETEAGLYCEIEYNTDLFKAATITRLLGHWQTLLAAVVAHPEHTLQELPLLTSEERQQLLLDWNRTSTAPDGADNLVQLFQARLRQSPDRIALVEQDAHITYAELAQRAESLAARLQQKGIGPEGLVCLYMERSITMVIAMLAVFQAGGAYIPLDPAYPGERIISILSEAQPGVILTAGHLKAQIAQAAQETLTAVIAIDEEDTQPDSWRQPAYNPQQLAYIIYTSGSTGRPKGVMVTQAGMLNHLQAKIADLDLRENDYMAQTASYSFDISVWQCWASLLVGGQVHIFSDEQAQDPQMLRRHSIEHGITVLEIVPSLLAMLLDDSQDAPALRWLLVTGEALAPDLCRRWFACNALTPLVNAYGPTECSDDVTHAILRHAPEADESTITIGTPIANTQIYILDERLQPLPIGVPGQLFVGGSGVGRGYLRAAERTASAFIPNPFSAQPGGRLYSTGDLARFRPDGQIEFLGRLDQQVKIRGFRIELGEIEAVIMQHPEVKSALALEREDSQQRKSLVAYIVKQDDVPLTSSDLRSYLQMLLPAYMLPSSLVILPAFPLTANGKIDRQALATYEWDSTDQTSPSTTYQHLTPLEEVITGIYQEVLGRGEIGKDENFFEIGGHSLLATQIVARLRHILDAEIPLRSIFEAPTIASISRRVQQTRFEEGHATFPPLLPEKREEAIPLSFAQRRLWFLDQLEPGGTSYNIPAAVLLQGEFNVQAMRQSLYTIIQRHESLRTTFQMYAGEPIQVIVQANDYQLTVHDLEAIPQQHHDAIVRHLAAQEANQPFDLARGPLFRSRLLRLSARKHVLLFTMHHSISDGWSMEIFLREIYQLYPALIAGAEVALPELPVQYADFALWQQRWLQGEVLEAQVRYWKQQLQDLAVLDLPTDYPRPAIQTFRGSRQGALLEPSLLDQLKALGQREGTTLFMTLLTAFQVLLARYSGQDDIAVGTPIAGRTHTELEQLIGFFVNTLVMRSDLAGDPAFRQLLARVRETTLQAYAHQDVPFEKLVEALQPERDLSRSPLFQVMFMLETTRPTASDSLPQGTIDLNIDMLEQEYTSAKFDLTLITTETQEGLLCEVEYNSDLFAAETIAGMLEHWQVLLEGIVARPSSPLSALPLLTPRELQLLLHTWNDSAVPSSSQLSLPQALSLQAAHYPDRVALSFQDQLLTFSELDHRADLLASFLQRHGIGPEHCIPLCLQRSPDLLLALLAVLKTGAAYLPLDPSYPAQRLRTILDEVRPLLLLTQQDLLPLVGDHASLPLCLDQLWPQLLDPQADLLPLTSTVAFHPDQLAYVIYTSGSTGRPKGVMVTQHNLLNFLAAMLPRLQLQEQDRWLAITSISFDIAALEIFLPLLCGTQISLAPRHFSSDGAALARHLDEEAITIMQATPTTWQLLLTTDWRPHADLQVLCGGEAFPPALASQLRPARTLWNLYGPTETTIWSAAARLAALERTSPVPLGAPLDNTTLYVLDRAGQLVPPGVPGELFIGGQGVARGYFRQAGLTAERFLPDPFSATPGERLYRTGDVVRYRANGRLEYLGRGDQQIKLRGLRIEIGEIEAALVQHPTVREAVVSLWRVSETDQRLVAYVIAQPNSTIATQQLRDHLRQTLPEYMVPAYFVQLEQLPLTANGKVDRRVLPAPDQQPDLGSQPVEATYTQLEEIIASQYSQLLNLTQVNHQSNFFEAGGHSLLATRLMTRLQEILEVEIPLRLLFEAPTVEQLAQQITQRIQGAPAGARVPLTPVAHGQDVPLSFAQQRIWFLDQLKPGNSAYNLSGAVRIKGRLQRLALQHSLTEIQRRHEIVRTTFPTVNEKPVQRIHAASPQYCTLINLSHLPQDESLVIAQRLAQQEALQPFDLAQGPLLRATLLCLQEEEYILLLTMHHIISDGWSMDILEQELIRHYQAFAQGRTSSTPDLPLQYADFAIWQQQWLEGEVMEKQLAYWKTQLQGVSPLQLPTDRPRPTVQTYRGAQYQVDIPAQLYSRLDRLCKTEGITLFMALLATFQILLTRYTGQTDITVGTPIANRRERDLEELIGFFSNTLVLRGDLAGNPTCRQILQRVRKVCLEAYSNQDTPFEKLVEVLQPERDLTMSPLFQVMFTLEQDNLLREKLVDVEISGLPVAETHAQFDLTLQIQAQPQSASCQMIYNTDLFNDGFIARMVAHWLRILEALVTDDSQCIQDISLLEEREQALLIHDWNNTATHYGAAEQSLQQLIEQQCTRDPDRIAVIFEQQQLSYGELERRSNQLAHFLRAQGIGPDRLVGLCLQRSLELVIAIIAVLKAGGAYVPLDPDYPTERLRFLIEDTHLSLVLTQHPLLPLLPSSDCRRLCLDRDWILVDGESDTPLPTLVHPEQLAYMIYTSGSTGLPKGAMNTQQALLNRLLWMQQRYQLDATDCVLQKTPFSFDVSVWEFFWPLLAGARLLLAAPEGQRDSAYLVALIRQQAVSLCHFVPSMLSVFLQEPEVSHCQSLRDVICSGEALSFELQQRFFARLGAGLHNLYGPTEAAIDVTAWTCQPESLRREVPIGRPIANLRVYVLDERLRPLPIGVPGELYLGGIGLARGYAERPALTAERFVPDPLSQQPGARLYRTGDRVRWLEDGTLSYLGRLDFQVKIRGQRIELGEIEQQLERHPAVRDAVVTTQPDSQHNPQLIAYLVPERDMEPIDTLRRLGEIQTYLQASLPLAMQPARWMWLSELPLTSNGKLDRKALPAPVSAEWEQRKVGTPRTPIEETLANIYCSLLQIPTVGIEDNFFALGGHSLLATQLVSRIRVLFQIELPLSDIFKYPHISALASHIEATQRHKQGISTPPLVPQPRQDAMPLSFAQQRLWFLHLLEPKSPAYNIPTALRLRGPLHVQALLRSLKSIIERHEILRTTFGMQNGNPYQQVAPTMYPHLVSVDLSGSPRHEQEILVQQLAQQEANRPFNLAQGPLLRTTLLHLGADKHIFLLTMHHIIADAWSMGILSQEISQLYQGFAAGRPAALPDLPIQYADFARWQRQWLQGDVLEQQLRYWEIQLHGVQPIELPLDHPRPDKQSYRGARYTFTLSQQLTRDLVELTRQEGATLFMTLITAFQILLQRITRQTDIAIGTDIANRNQMEVEGLIGFFVNLLIIRSQVESYQSFRTLLRQTHEIVLEAYTYQDTPFEMLVERLQPERSANRMPLAQVLFVLQNTPQAQENGKGELEISEIETASATTKFELALFMHEEGEGLTGTINYSTDSFKPATIERLMHYFEVLLQSIVHAPDVPLGQLEIYTEQEKERGQRGIRQKLRQSKGQRLELPSQQGE